jgi:hypothetical protein
MVSRQGVSTKFRPDPSSYARPHRCGIAPTEVHDHLSTLSPLPPVAAHCVRFRSHVCAHGRLPSGSRWLKPTREKVPIDDLNNPEYRIGRRSPAPSSKREPVRRPAPTQDERRARFAVETARAEFGRFYWNDELRRRMERELETSRRHKRQAEAALRRRRNGTHA